MTAGTGWCQEVRIWFVSEGEEWFWTWLKCSMFDVRCRIRIRCWVAVDAPIRKYIWWIRMQIYSVLYVLLWGAQFDSSLTCCRCNKRTTCRGVNKCIMVHISTSSALHVGPASCCRYSTNLASDINGFRGNLRSGDVNAQIVRCCRKFGIPGEKGYNLWFPE